MKAGCFLAIATFVALAACAPDDEAMQSVGEGEPPAPASIRTDLRDAAGRIVGTASATQDGSMVRIRIEGSALPAGVHGAHIHAVGRCAAPDFESAGPHWNPTDDEHGSANPAGMHKGDLPNLMIGTDGRGTLEYGIAGARLGAIDDGDGAALLIHAAPDDYRTDPSGNSGARIACGTFRQGSGSGP